MEKQEIIIYYLVSWLIWYSASGDETRRSTDCGVACARAGGVCYGVIMGRPGGSSVDVAPKQAISRGRYRFLKRIDWRISKIDQKHISAVPEREPPRDCFFVKGGPPSYISPDKNPRGAEGLRRPDPRRTGKTIGRRAALNNGCGPPLLYIFLLRSPAGSARRGRAPYTLARSLIAHSSHSLALPVSPPSAPLAPRPAPRPREAVRRRNFQTPRILSGFECLNSRTRTAARVRARRAGRGRPCRLRSVRRAQTGLFRQLKVYINNL
ncbi:hypothetical protein EVAR_30529_1 [Eumeta japonica]|uniref:Uncharacterized protein n=1 Tax=Eumeta variegata TaxID=151549 RepID=A0A4C1W0W7_EUMVA|nr:hypothetical protein EVAR_30529_1 [Eumeta japonica]